MLVGLIAAILAISFAIIALHTQETSTLRYKVPFVPFVPTLSIVFNAGNSPETVLSARL